MRSQLVGKAQALWQAQRRHGSVPQQQLTVECSCTCVIVLRRTTGAVHAVLLLQVGPA